MTTKIEKGYKVIDFGHNNILISFSMNINCSGVTYFPNSWTTPKPKNGPLAVFKTLKSAIRFCQYYAAFEHIYECEFVRSKDQSKMWIHKDYLLREHSRHPEDNSIMNREDFVEGTILADKVRLIRVITEDEIIPHLPSDLRKIHKYMR